MRYNDIMKILLGSAALAAWVALAGGEPSYELKYAQPAAVWEEALPLGSGFVGAMVWGGTAHETVDLNEDTVWSGSPNSNVNPDFKARLGDVRQAILAGDWQNADPGRLPGARNHGMNYQFPGSLKLDFEGVPENVDGYKRTLSLDNAYAGVRFAAEGVRHERIAFTPLGKGGFVYCLVAKKGEDGALAFRASLKRAHDSATTSVEDGTLVLRGVTSGKDGVPGKVRYTVLVQIAGCDGTVSTDGEALRVSDASRATVCVAIGTNFKRYDDISGDADAVARARLAALTAPDAHALFAAHRAAYRAQADRCTLDLGRDRFPDKTTDARLADFAASDDPYFAALYFRYGRYLLISCSQPGSQPANLQGIWNNSLTPPWCSKYTVNINTEMNYWPSEVTNLGELSDPLFKMIRELSVTGAKAAVELYGAKGWVTHHNTDIWRVAGPVDTWLACGWWPSGGGWLSTHLWEHWLYTRDRAFLEANYDILKGAAAFYDSFAVENPATGRLAFIPSNSPENTAHGHPNGFDPVCLMDHQLARDVWRNAIAAARELGRDADFAARLERRLERLEPDRVGRWGQLQEWGADLDSPGDHHRHVSHLYALYPSAQITPETPELFNAARVSLEKRGDISTGWAMGWRVCLWARLLDGDRAFRLIQNQLSPLGRVKGGGGTYPNLFDAHPPFQIDGNFGCTAGIAEMLMQSHRGFIDLLPALPKAWPEGRVKGLRARGGWTVDFAWRDGAVTDCTVTAGVGGKLKIRINGVLSVYDVAPGATVRPAIPTAAAVIPTARGDVRVSSFSDGSLRVTRGTPVSPELVFAADRTATVEVERGAAATRVRSGDLVAVVAHATGLVRFEDAGGRPILAEKRVGAKEIAFDSPVDERLYGLGQFQDGQLDVRNLPRRLTQVNTQIAAPFLVSTRGWGLYWHTYSKIEFNECTDAVALAKVGDGQETEVEVTTAQGGAREKRRGVVLEGAFTADAAGEYAFLFDCGREMSRRQYVEIDGAAVVDNANVWLPPTIGFRAALAAGAHRVRVVADAIDRPRLLVRPDRGETTFRSDVADGTDYIVYRGAPETAVARFRADCGGTAALPDWAWGYWHCQERYRSQDDLLKAVRYFKERGLPLSVIVQDWQWWRSGTWNSMEWDAQRFPDPKGMVEACHRDGVRVMLSVWSKTEGDSDFCRAMKAADGFIAGTSWIDFSKKSAADLYWTWFADRLVSTGVDAWWLDAVEPENDALHGRRIALGDGEKYRNIYPLLVNTEADRRLRALRPGETPLVLTRSAFPGQTRTACVMWSGDVGSSWQDLRTQIIAGLGFAAAGFPYWTSDAGGFFRPGDQYTNGDYQKRLVRWLQFATFCPIQRVHGFVSDTTPSRYGVRTEELLNDQVRLRERLRPYIRRVAKDVAENNAMMMRPLFDAPRGFETEYMFGPDLLVCPVTADVEEMDVWLPEGDWCDFHTGADVKGGRVIRAKTPIDRIPVYVRRRATFRNPVIYADCPDPTMCRAGEYVYLVTTTMFYMPGAPVMRSKDMIHWEIVSYIFDGIDAPEYAFAAPDGRTGYGAGQWATSLVHHDGKFYAWFIVNGAGGFLYTADRAEGPWRLLSRGAHLHDGSLVFDDDGRVYVFHGSGRVTELKADLTGVRPGGLDRQLFERGEETSLLEGSAAFKKDGYYYLMMVSAFLPDHPRREVCYRSKSLTGEWEKKVILETEFEDWGGVGQGCVVECPDGKWRALVFQDRGGIGRTPCLMDVTWKDGWPMLGDADGRIPNDVTRPYPSLAGLVGSDEFERTALDLRWQWNHNPLDGAWSLAARPGWLRLTAGAVAPNLFLARNTLTQRMVAPRCTGEIRLDVSGMKDGDRAGLAAFQSDSAVLAVVCAGGRKRLVMSEEKSVFDAGPGRRHPRAEVAEKESVELTSDCVYLRVRADFRPHQDWAEMDWSADGRSWRRIGTRVPLHFDWQRFFTGSRFAIFCYPTKTPGGHVDVDYFHFACDEHDVARPSVASPSVASPSVASP